MRITDGRINAIDVFNLLLTRAVGEHNAVAIFDY